jgi:hypothetical protein
MRCNLRKINLLLLAAALIAFVSLSDASAQTKKKKKRVTHRATVTKTKPQVSGDAGVVSLADQYQDGSTQIIDPSAAPTTTPSPQLPDETTRKLRDMQSRIKKLEAGSKPNDDDDKQKRLLTNLDILAKSEQRTEALRKQRFELIEKENTIRQRLDQIDVESRPEMIERSVATMGSLRPEELREAKRKSLDAEKRNLQSLLTEITATRSSLDQNVQRADALVEKIRTKLEKDIDDALNPDKPDDQ